MSKRKFKLTYFFDIRGRAEVMRLMFAAAKCPYDTELFDLYTTWVPKKPSTKCKFLPEMQIDGKSFAESLAINTFLAKEFGFYGSSALEQLAIEEVQHYRENTVHVEAGHYFEQDPAAKEKKAQELRDDYYPRMVVYFTEILKANGNGFAVGNKLSLADLVIFEGVRTMDQKYPDMLKKCPEIVSLRAKVANVDGIKEYLATVKRTEL